MPQAFVGAPQGALWGYDPTTRLWVPVQVGPMVQDGVTGEEYAPLMAQIANANPNGQATMVNSSPVVVASDQTPINFNVNEVGGVPTQMGSASFPLSANIPAIIPYFENGNGTNAERAQALDAIAQNFYSGSGMAPVGNYLFNGNNFSAERGNIDNIALLPSAAYTTTQTVADQFNLNAKGVVVVLDVTVPGTGSVTLEIDMKDSVSGKYIALLTGVAVTTLSTNVYTIYPGIAAVVNASANAHLTFTWRVKVTANNANPMTYSVGANLLI